MNTERHSSDNTILAEKIFTGYELVKPYINLILAAIVLVLIAFIGLRYYQEGQAKRDQAICNQIFQSVGDPAKLQEIAQNAKGAKLAGWAWALAGNNQLAVATESDNDKEKAKDALQEAENAFQQALQSRVEECRQMAFFGLARVYEQMMVAAPEVKDSKDKAIANYESLIAEFPDCFYADLAKARTNQLKNPETQKFLADYANRKIEEPKQEASELPTPLNIQAPAVPAAPVAPEAPKAEEAAPAAEAPKAEEAAPAAEAPKAE